MLFFLLAWLIVVIFVRSDSDMHTTFALGAAVGLVLTAVVGLFYLLPW